MRSFTIFIFCLLGLSASVKAMPENGMQELREEQLSPLYNLKWQANFTDKTIQFWMTVETTGYVGLGFSHSGANMIQADILIAGVENGQPYFQDYHGGSSNGMPTVDARNDWTLLNANESNGFTNIHMKRFLDTCDEQDKAITDGTLKIIWAIGKNDNIAYHDRERGGMAVNMLDPPAAEADLSVYDTFNMTSKINMTDETDTWYWCTMHKRVDTNKSHIVAFRPKLDTPEALKYTHHFNVYFCHLEEGESAEELFEPHIGQPGQLCHKKLPEGVTPIPRKNCYRNLYAWSFGGRVLVLPEDIGFPWGENPTEYFMLEVHLDNPGRQDNAIVETGVTYYYTYDTREVEAGMMAIGHFTNPGLMIPPSTKDWTLVGHCGGGCTEHNLDNEGIHIFNVNLHAHKSGRKMTMRHFRGREELPWMAKDDTYDFDYQENRPLVKPVNVLPGDHISMECTFDSNWKAGEAVIGGWASEDEMCMVFAFYYPRTQLESCFSGIDSEWILNEFNITDARLEEGNLNPIVVQPENWEGRYFTDILKNEVEWTQVLKDNLQRQLRYDPQLEACGGKDVKEMFQGLNGAFSKGIKQEPPTITYPEFDQEYTEPRVCSAPPTTTTSKPELPETTTPSFAKQLLPSFQIISVVVLISTIFLSKY